MHGYCTNERLEQRRKKIVSGIVIVSVFCTAPFNWLLERILSACMKVSGLGTVIHALSDHGISFAVSYATAFWLLYCLLDCNYFRKPFSLLTGMPDVRGTWKGTLHSNYNGGTSVDMTLRVKQRWMKMQCTAYFAESSSVSIMGRIYRCNDQETYLEFAYFNESQDPHVTDRSYYGFNRLIVRGETMRGFYFTNRRTSKELFTNGSIELKKVSTKSWVH